MPTMLIQVVFHAAIENFGKQQVNNKVIYLGAMKELGNL